MSTDLDMSGVSTQPSCLGRPGSMTAPVALTSDTPGRGPGLSYGETLQRAPKTEARSRGRSPRTGRRKTTSAAATSHTVLGVVQRRGVGARSGDAARCRDAENAVQAEPEGHVLLVRVARRRWRTIAGWSARLGSRVVASLLPGADAAVEVGGDEPGRDG